MSDQMIHTHAGDGPHHLMLGNVTVSRLLGGDQTAGTLALVELNGAPGSGPGPHVDPWRETFYVIDGELTFCVEKDGVVETLAAGPGDSVSIPSEVGHAFSVSSGEPARFLIMSSPAGIETFFADAGEPIGAAVIPAERPSFDRERLLAAFAKHGLTPYDFPARSDAAAVR
jgi:quercetin dioxygenase-like cupin family protein